MANICICFVLFCFVHMAAGSTSPVLMRLEQAASEKSGELALARETKAQKAFAIWSAGARWAPRLDLQLSQTRGKDFSFLSSGALGDLPFTFTPTETQLYGWSLNFTFPIYRRVNHLNLRQAFVESDLAELQLNIQKRSIRSKLYSLYGNYLMEVYRRATLAKSIEVARKSLRETQVRFDTGSKTKVDVLRAQSNVLALESRQLTSDSSIVAARNDLMNQLNLSDADWIRLQLDISQFNEDQISDAIEQFVRLDENIKIFTPLLEVKEAELQKLVSERGPFTRKARLEGELNEVRAGQAMSSEWPSLDLRGQLSKQAQQWDLIWNKENQSYSIGAVLTIPIFNFGSTYSTYEEMQHLKNAAEIQRTTDLRKALSDAQAQLLQANALKKSLEGLRSSLDQNQELERLSFKSYQLGRTTLIELLQSQSSLLEAKVNYAKSKVDLVALLWKLGWSLGWESQ